MERIPYTLARAYRDIRLGTEPWTPINEFLHEWADYSRDNRDALIAEPLSGLPEPGDSDAWRWAVFCVGMVEYLSEKDAVPRPAWVENPAYTLDAPWYAFDAHGPGEA